MFATMTLSVFLLPLLYMVNTSLQQPDQRTVAGAPVYPAVAATGTYQGTTYPIYVKCRCPTAAPGNSC
jgi:hypothetical protein